MGTDSGIKERRSPLARGGLWNGAFPWKGRGSQGVLAFVGSRSYYRRVHLLREMEASRARGREEARLETRTRLREALRTICPGRDVFVFGSLAQPGSFHGRSDVDIAVESLPEGLSQYGLIGWLEEELGRPVDVLLLAETRLREKILAQGERWTV